MPRRGGCAHGGHRGRPAADRADRPRYRRGAQPAPGPLPVHLPAPGRDSARDRRRAGTRRPLLHCPQGGARTPAPPLLPAIAYRLGVDVEPLDLADADTARWLSACVPPEIGAVTRFAAAVEVARAHPAATLRGDLVEVLPAVVEEVPADALLCVVDTYVHVFLPPDRQAAFRDLVAWIGRTRDVEWISVDPLVPLGPAATGTVQALEVPPDWLRDNRDGGLFGVIGRLGIRGGTCHGAVLGRTHPSAAWLEWTAPPG